MRASAAQRLLRATVVARATATHLQYTYDTQTIAAYIASYSDGSGAQWRLADACNDASETPSRAQCDALASELLAHSGTGGPITLPFDYDDDDSWWNGYGCVLPVNATAPAYLREGNCTSLEDSMCVCRASDQSSGDGAPPATPSVESPRPPPFPALAAASPPPSPPPRASPPPSPPVTAPSRPSPHAPPPPGSSPPPRAASPPASRGPSGATRALLWTTIPFCVLLVLLLSCSVASCCDWPCCAGRRQPGGVSEREVVTLRRVLQTGRERPLYHIPGLFEW